MEELIQASTDPAEIAAMLYIRANNCSCTMCCHGVGCNDSHLMRQAAIIIRKILVK